MTRWSLKNYFTQISHAQFMHYTDFFKQAVENSFGTECTIEIEGLSASRLYVGVIDKKRQSTVDRINKENRLFQFERPEDLGAEDWNRARHVRAVLKPVFEEKAPLNAFAVAEFKGELPKVATFYVQPEAEDIKKVMTMRFSAQKSGDGFEQNGKRYGWVPIIMF